MKPSQQLLEQYAALAVESGINLQKGQELVVRCPVECAYFARIIARKAYERGAREVILSWSDEALSKMKYTYSPLEVFETMPPWQADFNNYYAERGAGFLSILASDPEALSGVDPQKIIAGTKASHEACQSFYEKTETNQIPWNIIAVPSPAWAKKVFPGCDEEEAIEKLWAAILTSVRVDGSDPIAAWEAHKESFQQKKDFLNQKQFTALHYQNSLGTDLVVGMPKNHIWEGGGDVTKDGFPFFPNMPTEEVFSVPDKDHIDGTLVSSMPLNHNGSLIENFRFTFRDGLIVDYSAQKGEELLKHILDTDEGSRRLGEIALVPADSPISNLNILFYNTLFDENASCHFALGSAYPSCIEDGCSLSKEELAKRGVNDSINHIDFMVGTKDLSITGIEADGTKTPIFVNGNWAF